MLHSVRGNGSSALQIHRRFMHGSKDATRCLRFCFCVVNSHRDLRFHLNAVILAEGGNPEWSLSQFGRTFRVRHVSGYPPLASMTPEVGERVAKRKSLRRQQPLHPPHRTHRSTHLRHVLQRHAVLGFAVVA